MLFLMKARIFSCRSVSGSVMRATVLNAGTLVKFSAREQATGGVRERDAARQPRGPAGASSGLAQSRAGVRQGAARPVWKPARAAAAGAGGTADRRPPAGNFALLASRGFGRVVLAALAAAALSLLVVLAFSAALAVGVPAIAGRPSVGLLAGVALLASVFVIAAVMVDLLARLMLVRAAAFGDSASGAFGRAASLLGSRLGACLIVTGVFLL